MKKMKTLASLVLALVLAMALTVPAFADAPQTGTIKIEKPADVDEALTYTIYQVFSMTRAANATDKTGYSYTATSTVKNLIEANPTVSGYFTFGAIAGDTSNFTVTPTDSYNEAAAKTFSQFLKDHTSSLTSLTTVTFGANDTAKVKETSEIAYGYYFVDSTVGTLCMLDSFTPTVTITDKNAQPGGGKTVTVPDDAKIGTDVTYHIWVEITDGATNYVVTDTMSAGLDFNNDIAIGLADTKGGDTTVHEETTYENQTKAEGETFKIKFLDSFLTANIGKWIDIQYTATINNNAVVQNGNTATLSYGNGHSVTFDPANFLLYSFNLIKTNGTDELSGAKFKLYDAETGGSEIKVVAHTKTTEEPWDYAVTTDNTGVDIEVGNKVIFGLGGNGTYYLEETEAPSGYNKLTARVAVKFVNGQLQTIDSTTNQFENSSNVTVVNQTGAELPSTGGMGTTLFYTIGGLLVVCSAILIVTKKRMSSMA